MFKYKTLQRDNEAYTQSIKASSQSLPNPIHHPKSINALNKRLGVASPSGDNPESQDMIKKRHEMLNSIEAQQPAIQSTLARYLAPMQMATQLISSAFRPGGSETTVIDGDLEKQLDQLESRIQLLQKDMNGLDDSVPFRQDTARDSLVKRWAKDMGRP